MLTVVICCRRVTVYMGFVSFMILVWDHIITLGDEVGVLLILRVASLY